MDRPVLVIVGIVTVAAATATFARRVYLAHRIISNERRRIAADLHDGALQSLASALAFLRVAERLLQSEEEHPAFQHLTNGTHLAQAGIDEIRKVLFPLAADGPVIPGLAAQVRCVVRRFGPGAPMAVHVAPLPDLSSAPAVEEAVGSIVGEALTNTGKHAQARNVWVEVSVNNDAVTGVVRDDGIGFDPDEIRTHAQIRKTLGLHFIQERARLVGGRVTIASCPNVGTVVEAQLPLRPAVGSPTRDGASEDGRGEPRALASDQHRH